MRIHIQIFNASFKVYSKFKCLLVLFSKQVRYYNWGILQAILLLNQVWWNTYSLTPWKFGCIHNEPDSPIKIIMFVSNSSITGSVTVLTIFLLGPPSDLGMSPNFLFFFNYYFPTNDRCSSKRITPHTWLYYWRQFKCVCI